MDIDQHVLKLQYYLGPMPGSNLSHAISDRIIYFNNNGGGMTVQPQCALGKRRQVSAC